MQRDLIKKLDFFFSQFPEFQYKKGELLIHAGREPAGIFYIKKGVVREYLISKKGDEITLNLYKPHVFLPMSWAVSNIENNHFFEALIPVVARRAPRKDILNFIKQEPDIMYDLLKRIYTGISGLWLHIESLTTGNSYSKLATTLIILAKRFGKREQNKVAIQLKMNEKDIANYAGMSRETASRELQKLKNQHILTFTKGIVTIHNVQFLENSLTG